jgi:hypothetical protein
MDAKWETIRALDLSGVKAKFAFKKGRWWQFWNSADRIEQQYRQFLYLIAMNPGETVVPWSQDLDDFWHENILNTAKYAKDCEAIFGQFLHHNPHLPEGTPAHTKAAATTQKMYRAAFKEKAAKKRSAARCGAGCGTDMTVVFCASGGSVTHHADAGHHGSSHDAGAGHHSCGGHSGGGHGCGGHGCGGHGCGGGGH